MAGAGQCAVGESTCSHESHHNTPGPMFDCSRLFITTLLKFTSVWCPRRPMPILGPSLVERALPVLMLDTRYWPGARLTGLATQVERPGAFGTPLCTILCGTVRLAQLHGRELRDAPGPGVPPFMSLKLLPVRSPIPMWIPFLTRAQVSQSATQQI